MLYLLSILIVVQVLRTQERRFKNVAHFSWVSPSAMLITGSIFQCLSTVLSLFLNYECTVYEQPTQFVQVEGNPDLAPLLSVCLSNESPTQQSAAIPLNLASQVTALDQLYQQANQFLASTSEYD